MSTQNSERLEIEATVPARERRKSERREHPRLPSPPLDVGGLWARIYDISLGGICLILNAPLKVGDQYGLVLTDGMFQAQDIHSEVVWSHGSSAGLRWVDLSPEQENWLREQFSREPGLRVALLKGRDVH